MKIKAILAVVAMATSGVAVAENYQSFSFLDYTSFDFGTDDADGWILGTRYFLDERPALGPLDQFTYINPISNFGAAYARFDDDDVFLFDGEYFFGKFVVGAAATDEDGFEQARIGYLFTENFLARIEAVDEFDDTELFVSAQYQMNFEGNDYLGFTARVDDDLDNLALSAKYFRALSGRRYLAVGASLIDTDGDSFAILNGSFYWTERTSASLGLREDGDFTVGFKHFFNSNISLGVDYEEDESAEVFSLRLGAQF